MLHRSVQIILRVCCNNNANNYSASDLVTTVVFIVNSYRVIEVNVL